MGTDAVSWGYLSAFALVAVAATWFCARLGRGGASTTPETLPIDYGDSALERLPRAPSLPPPGHEELRLTVPEVPQRAECWHSAVMVGDELVCAHCGAVRGGV